MSQVINTGKEQNNGPIVIDGTQQSAKSILGDQKDFLKAEQYNLKPIEENNDDIEAVDNEEGGEDSYEDELPDTEDSETDNTEEKGEEKDTKENPQKKVNSYIDTSQEYKEVQIEQKALTRQLQRINTIHQMKPKEPENKDDEQVMDRYYRRLDDWEIRKEQAIIEGESLQKELRDASIKAQDVFLAEHPDIEEQDKKGFYNFIVGKEGLYLEFLSGESTLNELFEFYKIKTRQIENRDYDRIKRLRQEKARIKPVKVQSSAGEGLSQGQNGLPRKFKYANKPMFKAYVKDLIQKKYSLSGERLTAKMIDDLCKQEFEYLRGKVPVK